MLALLCLATITADLPPYVIHQIAASDLRAVAPDARPYTRYASMHGIPEAERESFREAFDLAANGVSIRGDLYRSKVVGGGLLLRIDLRGWGWDKYSREFEIENLAKLGVRLNLKSDRDKTFYIDFWETIGYHDPFFVATDAYRRGWLNPAIVEAASKVAHTHKLVVAAHWLYPRLLLEADNGGFYSQLLLNPPDEADFEKRWGLFRKFLDVDIRAKHGAAVVKSQVAYNPRELQFYAGGTGWDQHWYSKTLDFIKADRADKDVRESPAGTSKADASEVLLSLPNGLMGGALFNGAGKQQAIAPQNVAEDQRPAAEGRYYCPTKTVFTMAKCLDCHGESRGLIGFDDNIIKLVVPPRSDTAYLVLAYDAKIAARETQRFEEFYRKGLKDKLQLYRESYEARVKELTGHDVLDATRNLLRWYDRYTPAFAAEPVQPDVAARESGYPPYAARALWKAASVQGQGKPAPPLAKSFLAQFVYQATAPFSETAPAIGFGLFSDYPVQGTNQLGFLAAGQPITRIQWEKTVGDGLAQDLFAWDRVPVSPQIKATRP